MKRLVIFILNLTCVLTMHAMISKSDIPNIINKVVTDSTSEIWIANSQYTQGDTIYLWNGFLTCPFDEAWAAFIDYKPMHNWAHKCAYLFIDKVTGEYKQFEKTLPPLRISEQWTKYRTFRLHEVDANTSLYPQWLTLRDSLNRSRIQRDSSRTAQDNSHLYAIIIDYCGRYYLSHYERLWNDCAAMYTTFIDNGYAKSHIYVAMPNESSEMPADYFGGGDYNSPLVDLDNDGLSDVGYSATTAGVFHLFDDISYVLTEDDILTIYLTGHGDISTGIRTHYYGYEGILADVGLPDSQLLNLISSLNVRIFNIIGQRTGQIDIENNLLSILSTHMMVFSLEDMEHRTSDSYIIDEYTLRWTSAVNGEDMGVCDLNGDGNISMFEAHSYAIAGNTNPSYSPSHDSRPICLTKNLTLTEILDNEPCLQSDLYIKDNDADSGAEPNQSDNFYNSESIWLEDMAGNVALHPISTIPYNVCVKIHNRGTASSTGDEVLHLHWTKAAIGGKWPDSWID